MNLKGIAANAGLTYLQKVAKPSTIDAIKPQTAIAANIWALGFPGIGEEPFPSAVRNDNVVSDSFDVAGWGRVWIYQRQFWLNHRATGIKARWINGRISPQEIKQ